MALKWFFRDEADASVLGLLDQLRSGTAIAPGLWAYEIGNVLVQAQFRGRITEQDGVSILERIAELPIEVVPLSLEEIFREVSPLARRFKLTSYDAAYLFLSMKRSLPLATRDQALGEAAGKVGVAVI